MTRGRGARRRPVVVALAGPNGAGKSTVGPSLLAETLHIDEFVNADVIARGLSGFDPESAAFAAGRVMLVRLAELAERRVDFAFETTLAGRGYVHRIGELCASGYDFHIVFLCPDRHLETRQGGGDSRFGDPDRGRALAEAKAASVLRCTEPEPLHRSSARAGVEPRTNLELESPTPEQLLVE